MNKSKKVIIGTLVLSVFVFMISVISLYIEVTIQSGNACNCIIPLPLFIPFVGSLGLFIGTLVYHLFSQKPESIKSFRVLAEFLLNLLSEDEAKILKILAENKGKLSQAKIVSLTEISKVRVFRALEKMKAKNLIEKKPAGKTNIIVLNENVRNFILHSV